MKIDWSPAWYELDQALTVGAADYYYLTKNRTAFSNGEENPEDISVFGETIEISHPELGSVQRILTHELSYRIYLNDRDYIQVDAEENVGSIEFPADCRVNEWNFKVTLNLLGID